MQIYFAPLQGYTEAPYRRIHQQVCGGIDTYYTPFIRWEHGKIRPKDLREALPENNVGVPVVPQVIANGKDEFQQLVDQLIQVGHRQIDVNMGCPFPLQTRLGRGSGLLSHTDKVEEILQALSHYHDEQGIQFSVKMRLGQESDDEAFAILPLLNAAPLDQIALHPRVGKEQYKGDLHTEAFTRFYQECKHPLVYNGMLTTVQEMHSVADTYPQLKGLMIGRGLLSRPTLAWEFQQGKMLSEAEVKEKVLSMHRLLFDYYQQHIEGGDGQLVQKMQTFWEYLEPIFGHKAIKKILKSGSLRNYREAVSNASV